MLHHNVILLLLSYSISTASAADSNYTVTHEAWFDISVQPKDEIEAFSGRITIALFEEAAPITTLNFRLLTQGYKNLTYNNTIITKVVPDFIIQLGDVMKLNGSGSESVYGGEFRDEPFILSHRSPGWVSMANKGPDTNGCQFFILLVRARWLNEKHVVFGKVIRGYDFIMKVSDLPTGEDQMPKTNVTVVNCGVNKMSKPYELPEEARDAIEDFSTPYDAEPFSL